MERTLRDIVDADDLRALENYCLRRGTYHQVRRDAIEQGIDLGLLEELLGEI